MRNITINSSSVTASSTNGAGIGGGKGGAGSNNITINGGSVKASSVSGSPTNKGKEVYCCTIENPENANVTIKPGTGNWKPVKPIPLSTLMTLICMFGCPSSKAILQTAIIVLYLTQKTVQNLEYGIIHSTPLPTHLKLLKLLMILYLSPL